MSYLDLHFDKRRLWRGNKAVQLSASQQKLARLFINAKGVPLTAEEVMEHMWGGPVSCLTAAIARLRQQLYVLDLAIISESHKGYHLTDKLHIASELLQKRYDCYLAIHASLELKRALDDEAKRTGKTRSDVIRFILADALGVEERPGRIGGDHRSALFRQAHKEVRP